MEMSVKASVEDQTVCVTAYIIDVKKKGTVTRRTSGSLYTQQYVLDTRVAKQTYIDACVEDYLTQLSEFASQTLIEYKLDRGLSVINDNGVLEDVK